MHGLNLIFLLTYNLVLFFCFLHSIDQTLRIISDYMRFEVLNEVKTGKAEMIKLPDVSFCAMMNRFINFSLLQIEHPTLATKAWEIGKVSTQSEFLNWTSEAKEGKLFIQREIVESLTVAQLLRLTYTPNTFISTIEINSAGDFNFLPQNVTKILCRKSSFVKDISVCIAVQCSPEGDYKMSRENLLRTSGIMARFFLMRETAVSLQSINIYLHSPNTFPRGLQIPYTTIKVPSTQAGREYIIDFAKIETYLLPYPYTTRCLDYSKLGFESQVHRWESCCNQWSTLKTGVYCRFSIEYPNVTQKMAQYYYGNIKGSVARQKVLSEILAKCDKLDDSPDCNSEVYIPILRSVLTYRNGLFKVQIVLPTEAHIINRCKPKRTLDKLLFYIFSILTFWYGFCVTRGVESATIGCRKLSRFLVERFHKEKSLKQVFKRKVSSQSSKCSNRSLEPQTCVDREKLDK